MYFERKGTTIVPALLMNVIKVSIQISFGKSLKLSKYFFIIIELTLFVYAQKKELLKEPLMSVT